MIDLSQNAEKNVIGALLISPETLSLINLTAEDFRFELNKVVFSAVLALQKDGKPIDALTVQEQCSKDGANISAETLIDYMEATGTAANIETYARVVTNNSLLRKLRDIGEELSITATDATDAQEILFNLTKQIDEIRERGRTAEVIDSPDAIADFIKYRKKFDKNPDGAFVRTGYTALDGLLGGGLLNSGLYIMGARPGMGKTSVALNIAENVAEKTGRVLFVSLEMSKEQITAKRLARHSGISASDLLMQKLNKEQYDKVYQSSAEICKNPVIVNRKLAARVADIQNMAVKAKPRLLVVDYLGLVKSADRRKSRYEEVSEVSHDLKSLAMRLEIPILCLAQLNRDNEQTNNKMPKLNNLRDSGDIEQDADGVLFIYRPDYYDREVDKPQWESSEMSIILAKNRHGNTGISKFAWFGATGKIYEQTRGKK